MERISRFRAHILLLIFVLILGFYAFHLYDVQIIQTGGSKDNSTTFTTLTRIKAARGDILDCNGNLLVSNRASFDLVLNHYVLLNANNTNQHLYDLAMFCKERGIEYADHFPITEERPFTYTLDEYDSTWQGYFQSYLAYNDDLDSDITAPLLIEKLRQRYKFPAEWTDEEARMVIGLRYEMSLRNCVPSLSNYVFLADAQDDDLSAIVEMNIPGMNVEASTVREYNTTYAAHILGYVGPMNAEQWEYYKTVDGYEMDAEVGQAGLEMAYEEYLHGVDGWREDTVTADGELVSSRYLQEPKAGSNVEVSIDLTLQITAENSLEELIMYLRNQTDPSKGGLDAEGGALVAMDVKTGQVLACASYPTYDLASFFDNYEELSEDPYKPLFNRALLGVYPPGSTYKLSMVVAGFADKLLTSETTIETKGRFTKYPNFGPTCLYYRDTKYSRTHGTINASKALCVSCNYFFYDLGDRVRLSTMDATAKGLGLGEPTGVELVESIGQRANEETKAKIYTGGDTVWFAADQVLAAIGQSDNRFTPMQLCVYATTLANQGTRYKATFMNRVVSSDYRSLLEETKPEIAAKLEISDDCYKAYTEGMRMVVEDPTGTAYGYFAGFPISVLAKTGSADDVPGASSNGAFICLAPAEDPQIAIAVYVEKAGRGAILARVAKAVMEVYFDVDEVADVTTYENKLS